MTLQNWLNVKSKTIQYISKISYKTAPSLNRPISPSVRTKPSESSNPSLDSLRKSKPRRSVSGVKCSLEIKTTSLPKVLLTSPNDKCEGRPPRHQEPDAMRWLSGLQMRFWPNGSNYLKSVQNRSKQLVLLTRFLLVISWLKSIRIHVFQAKRNIDWRRR